MKTGFVPALGTPLDENGNLVAESYRKQIHCMIDAGASALLCMGSMGQQAFISSEECVNIAACAVDAANGRVPVFVGVMDNSIRRVKQRMESMEFLSLDAFVCTTPYYEIDTDAQILNFFEQVGHSTSHGFILYDLPPVTKKKITYDMVVELKKRLPNLVGIKTADLTMLRKIRLNPDMQTVKTFYSGLDTFDIGYMWGVGYILDGMLSCTPKNTDSLVRALNDGDRKKAASFLDNIVALRDVFLALDLWPAYSCAMNMLGFEGFFSPDWAAPADEKIRTAVYRELVRIGEIRG